MFKAFMGLAVGWGTALAVFVVCTHETKSAQQAPPAAPSTHKGNPATKRLTSDWMPPSLRRARIENPAIDMPGYLKVAEVAAEFSEPHRVSEREFLRMSREPGTVILDARSAAKFDELHISGAINLSFADISIPTLAKTLPDKSARILIYCNNNFAGAPGPFAPKAPTASLNLSTYIALYNYGYRNVYELGPLIDIKSTILPFESTRQRSVIQNPYVRPFNYTAF